MVAGYFMPGEGEQFEYDDLQRRKRLAEALMQQGSDYSPVQSWTQGAARIAQALSGSLQREYANKLGQQGAAAYEKKMSPVYAALAGGSTAPAAAGAGPAPSPTPNLPAMASGGAAPRMVMPDPVSANLDPKQRALLNAIAAPESAGAYDVRYTPKGGRSFAGFDVHPGIYEPGPAGPSSAAGRYQFTKTTWDRMGGGAFTPENQDQRALALATQDYKARTGRDLMADLDANGFTPQIAQALGPTWAGLKDNPQKAIAAYQATIGRSQPAAAPAPTQVAQAGQSPDGVPLNPVPSSAPAMAYAPAQQAIAQAAPQVASTPQAAPQPAPRGQQLAQAVGAPAMPQPQPTGNIQAAMMQILSDPRFSPQQKAQAMQMYQMGQRDEGVSPIDLGDKVALVNKRGQVTGYMPKTRDGADWQLVKDADNNPIGRFNARTGIVEPVTPGIAGQDSKSPTVQRIKQPDGSEVAVQWDKQKREWVPLKAPEGGNPVASPKLTEAQSKDVGFYNRGEKLIPRLEKQDTALTDFFSRNAANVPMVGNFMKSDAYRQAEQTARELLAVILRKDTGAAVTDREFENYGVMYLPQPGDDAQTIRQKREGRKTAIEGIRMGLGTADVLFKQREALDGARTAPNATETAPSAPVRRKYDAQGNLQ